MQRNVLRAYGKRRRYPVIDISSSQRCGDCGNRRTDQWEHLIEGLSRYKNTARLADLAAPVV